MIFIFVSCEENNDSKEVSIRISNISQFDFTNIIVNTYNNNVAFIDLNSGSKSDYKDFEQAYREIEVVPNFIVPNMDTTRVNEEMRSKYATKDEVILCHISNFRKVKRVEDVIQVFAKVNTKIKSKLKF